MNLTKHSSIMRLGLVALMAAALTGCGGGGGGGGGSNPPPSGTPSVNLSKVTANNPNDAFSALTGIPVVTSASPTKVNFAVVGSNGQPVQGLTLFNAAGAGTGCGTYNVRFAIAKLVKGAGTAPDNWQSLISRVRASGNPEGFVEGTTDPVPSATVAAGTAGVGSLTYNAAGYYTYTFGTDLANPAYVAGSAVSTDKIFTNGNTLAKDGTTIYRVGMQLCYVDANGKTVISNPIYDFTMGSNGSSSPAAAMRMVVNKDSCNECHGALAVHGGRRVDPNYCVLCHNPGSVDYHDENLAALGYPDGGAPIDLKYMIHKFHMGDLLTKDYKVAGLSANEIKYPQDVRNCTKCHDNGKAANADNWKNVPSRNACGACHDGIDFATGGGTTLDPTSPFATLGHVGGAQADDSKCTLCHSPAAINVYHIPVTPPFATNALDVSGGNANSNAAWIASNDDNLPAGAIKVSYDIQSVSRDASKHPVMVFRMLQNGVRTDLNTFPAKTEIWDNFIGSPSVYFVFSVPQDGIAAPADFNASASGYLKGIWNGSASGTGAGTLTGPDANGYYTVTLTGVTIPDNAVMLTGGLGFTYSLPATQPLTQTNVTGYPMKACGVAAYGNRCGGLIVPARNAVKVATGYTGRRAIVDNAKCNLCHEKLGEFTDESFHAGQRNDGPTCSWCHNPNRASGGWSADSTNFVHAIHAGTASVNGGKRTTAFTWHATDSQDNFGNVRFPNKLNNCEACHVPGTYDFSTTLSAVPNRLYRTVASGTVAANPIVNQNLQDLGFIVGGTNYGTGFSFNAGTGVTTAAAPTTLVDSPIATACFACHDGDMVSSPGTKVRDHIEQLGGGSIYRSRTSALAKTEQCLLCHGPNSNIAPIKAMHGL